MQLGGQYYQKVHLFFFYPLKTNQMPLIRVQRPITNQCHLTHFCCPFHGIFFNFDISFYASLSNAMIGDELLYSYGRLSYDSAVERRHCIAEHNQKVINTSRLNRSVGCFSLKLTSRETLATTTEDNT